jgi:hypothetical protein
VPEQNEMEPVGPGPKIRPVGLGLHALFSKKPETEPDLRARAQARPTSKYNRVLNHYRKQTFQQVRLNQDICGFW